jgi:hypothetical protein
MQIMIKSGIKGMNIRVCLVTINISRENIYCVCSGNICNSLNKFRHESILRELVIILIILFCILNMIFAWAELPQNITPLDIIEWTKAK